MSDCCCSSATYWNTRCGEIAAERDASRKDVTTLIEDNRVLDKKCAAEMRSHDETAKQLKAVQDRYDALERIESSNTKLVCEYGQRIVRLENEKNDLLAQNEKLWAERNHLFDHNTNCITITRKHYDELVAAHKGNDTLASKNAKLEDLVSNLSRSNSELLIEVEGLRSQNIELCVERDRLLRDKVILKADSKALRVHYDTVHKDHQQALRDMHVIRQERDRLQLELDGLNPPAITVHWYREEIAKLNDRVGQLTKENIRLEKAVVAWQGYKQNSDNRTSNLICGVRKLLEYAVGELDHPLSST